MAKVQYRYIPFPVLPSPVHPEGTTAYRPVAAATITANNGESLRWIVLPDTGADACLFPLSLASLLRLELSDLPREMTTGVGSQSNLTYYAPLEIDMGESIVFRVLAGFTQGLDSVGVGLLGQSGFFDSFNVEFRHADKIFTVDTL